MDPSDVRIVTLDARARELLLGHLARDEKARYVRIHVGRG